MRSVLFPENLDLLDFCEKLKLYGKLTI